MELKKGDIVYYARILPNVDIYDVLDIKLRTIEVEHNYIVGTESHDKQAFLFKLTSENTVWFRDRKQALKVVKEAEKHKIKRIKDDIIIDFLKEEGD